MTMRTPEQWEMIVQVERALLNERTRWRMRLGELPDSPPHRRWPMPWLAAWRPLRWAGRAPYVAGLRLLRGWRQPDSGFGGA